MDHVDQTIINAVLRRAETLCPGSLALLGVYGSAATGDRHEKSDLDLLVLVDDERGWALADGFLLDDTAVGYDIYCTSWEMLEADARCEHAHLSKLLDSVIVYRRDEGAQRRLDALRERATETLASDQRFGKAENALNEAKKKFAEACLTDSLPETRRNAGAAVLFVEDALMLYNGRYFRKGTKRALEELRALELPFCIEAMVMNVIGAETVEGVRKALAALLAAARGYLKAPKQTKRPSAEELRGTYEEMYSNWRNKMAEAAERGDAYSSFMALLSFREMLRELASETGTKDIELMDRFDPNDLQKNARVFEEALNEYLAEYERAGLQPKHFANAEEFAREYCKAPE